MNEFFVPEKIITAMTVFLGFAALFVGALAAAHRRERLDKLISSCGIDASGRAYEEVLPELVGSQVTTEIQQYMNQNTSEIGNQVGQVYGDSQG